VDFVVSECFRCSAVSVIHPASASAFPMCVFAIGENPHVGAVDRPQRGDEKIN
jgi:hypothetical protein